MMPLKILHVVSEVTPWVKTGGLADVAAALPAALCAIGERARVLVPGYPGVLDAIGPFETIWEDPNFFGGGRARLLWTHLASFEPAVYVLDAPGLYDRQGGPYQRSPTEDWPDNHLRFAALSWVAARVLPALSREHHPDIVHAHDWQAGLAPAYLHWGLEPRLPSVMTIHNIDYAGLFPARAFGELSLPAAAFDMHGVEFYGKVSFLKAGLYYADWITTVSPTYAREIEEEGRGGGFEGLLRDREGQVSGILNGVDSTHWNPADDAYIPVRYSLEELDRKADNKAALRARLRLDPSPDVPVFGVISRLVPQKGIDWVVEAIPWLVERGAQLVVTGSGEPEFEQALVGLANRFPGRVAVHIGYDEGLAHWIQAGADCILVPSRSEPCGLTQLYALRYGSPPLVRRTGGLADTVVDTTVETLREGRATGFVFAEPNAQGLRQALYRAISLWSQPEAWARLQQNGMTLRHDWRTAANEYRELYTSLVYRRTAARAI